MRRLLISLVLAAALVPPAAALAGPVFVFRGHGWGHAVGMAQYGAYGFAQNGWTYDQILAHYYPGTELGPAPTSAIRVLLASGRRSLEIGSDALFRVRDAQGLSATLPAGSVQLGTDLTLAIDGELKTLAPPVRFLPAGKPLELGRPYRGSIVVTLVNGKLQVVNRVGLEKYLYGVVPGEMPSDWHPEALEVQAVAARSYALASRKTGGSFDVYADTRSQVYGGIEAERASTNAAVDATRGQVVLYGGKVAWTYFSSSSGGKTAAIEDVWPDAERHPYLVSVDDPYDTISPYHDWGPVTFTAEELAAKLGSRVPAGLTELQVSLNASGRVGTVTAIGAGGQTEISGWDMRMLLGLRSTWFTIDALELEPSARRVVYGQKVQLNGVARGVKQVTLELRPAGGSWEVVEAVKPSRDGTFAIVQRPEVTTYFRLKLGKVVGPTVRVAVAPKVTLEQIGARALEGGLRPGRPGIEVRIQRKSGSAWQTVTTVVAGEDGAFGAKLDLSPGVYRAWVAPSNGLVSGTSPALSVGGA
jgi:stage II sporulation protein D